jgi:hypothetical protein
MTEFIPVMCALPSTRESLATQWPEVMHGLDQTPQSSDSGTPCDQLGKPYRDHDTGMR